MGNSVTLRRKNILQQISQIKVKGKKGFFIKETYKYTYKYMYKYAKLPSHLTWSTKHKVMSQNKASKEPGHFQNLYVLNFPSYALRLPAYISSVHNWQIFTQAHIFMAVRFSIQFSGLCADERPDWSAPGWHGHFALRCQRLAKPALFQHHSGTTVPMSTRSHGMAGPD